MKTQPSVAVLRCVVVYLFHCIVGITKGLHCDSLKTEVSETLHSDLHGTYPSIIPLLPAPRTPSSTCYMWKMTDFHFPL